MESSPTSVGNCTTTQLTGLALVADNQDAIAVRILTARESVSTLDMMYYMWRDDHSGQLLLSEVLAAADRGVRVRLLIDDINPQSSDATYLAVNDHPNVEVRLFNPSIARNGSLMRKFELVTRMFSMTKRMHNKAWIADRRVAIVGGRNIGDEYFDAADTNFRDLDLVMFGAGAAATCAVFDAYWNHEFSKSVHLLNPLRQATVHQSNRLQLAREADARTQGRGSLSEFLAGECRIHWVADVRVLADPPDKVAGRHRGKWLVHEILPVLRSAAKRLDIVSPYFIPGRAGIKVLADLLKKGVAASVVTNSLASTDVAGVHGAYTNYRRRLLEAGVGLYEFRALATKDQLTVFGSKGVSLHTKAFVVDRHIGFIGSFNFDPRSSSLNAEMGVLFNDASLAADLESEVERDKSPSTSFHVTLAGDQVMWTCTDAGKMRMFRREPGASLKRRLIAAAVRWIPIESQL